MLIIRMIIMRVIMILHTIFIICFLNFALKFLWSKEMQNNTSNKLQKYLDCNQAMVQRGESTMAFSIIAITNIFKVCVKTMAYCFHSPLKLMKGKPEQWELRLSAIIVSCDVISHASATFFILTHLEGTLLRGWFFKPFSVS